MNPNTDCYGVRPVPNQCVHVGVHPEILSSWNQGLGIGNYGLGYRVICGVYGCYMGDKDGDLEFWVSDLGHRV